MSRHDFTLRFSRRYSMAHRLTSGLAPRCAVPHGHDEVVTVEIVHEANAALDPGTQMLVEFDQAKRRWFDWIDRAVDHSFHLNEKDPLVGYFRENEPGTLLRCLLTPGDPTTELRAACYKAKIGAFFAEANQPLRCKSLTIQETPTNAVICEASALERILPAGDHWWWRADESINDLRD